MKIRQEEAKKAIEAIYRQRTGRDLLKMDKMTPMLLLHNASILLMNATSVESVLCLIYQAVFLLISQKDTLK